MKALEAELVGAEIARKERTIAQRYHRVKFFGSSRTWWFCLRLPERTLVTERQKVTRKLTQTKRQLETCTDKKEHKKLEKALKGLRVDLNYILVRRHLSSHASNLKPVM